MTQSLTQESSYFKKRANGFNHTLKRSKYTLSFLHFSKSCMPQNPNSAVFLYVSIPYQITEFLCGHYLLVCWQKAEVQGERLGSQAIQDRTGDAVETIRHKHRNKQTNKIISSNTKKNH